MKKTKIGIYGKNGHQITEKILKSLCNKAEITGFCSHPVIPGAAEYSSLGEMLKNPDIELVSLCSPVRAEQANDAVLCMRAGKHVYAEKPCAMNEADLDMILKVQNETGKIFHEMAGTVTENPYYSMKQIVKNGTIGEVIQVFAQKSYPKNFNIRPQDENIDGGLIMQAGIHALRYVEHITGIRISEITATETQKGNTAGSGLHIAASIMMRLENSGLACAIVNYLNPKNGFGQHGNEHVRIFGEKGFIEAVDGGRRTRLVLEDMDMGEIPLVTPVDFLEAYLDELSGTGTMSMSQEEELHPLRMVIRAKENAVKNKKL